jgi:hypothetical protein
MPIVVTCPGCHKRFQVSDKFAGKTGPCPKCKTQIRIPTKEEEVVVHAPEEFGPKTTEGRAVLKPIERTEVKLSPVIIVAICAGVLATLLVAFVLGLAFRETGVPQFLLGLGAVALAPPVVFAGYTFLRNDELEPYRGVSLGIRVAICSVVYALLWGIYAVVATVVLGGTVEMWHLFFVAPVLIGIGALGALACLDLDYGTACIHYGFYLIVTVVLRLVMGLTPF